MHVHYMCMIVCVGQWLIYSTSTNLPGYVVNGKRSEGEGIREGQSQLARSTLAYIHKGDINMIFSYKEPCDIHMPTSIGQQCPLVICGDSASCGVPVRGYRCSTS